MKKVTKFKDLTKTLNIGWTGSNFDKYFLDMEVKVPKKLKLESKVLEKDMTNFEIIKEWQPKEATLGELVYALKNDLLSKNGYSNIFHIRDKDNILWAVSASWGSSGRYWDVGARLLGDRHVWLVGRQFLSSKFSLSSVPVPLDSLAQRIKSLEEDMEKIKQVINKRYERQKNNLGRKSLSGVF